MPRFEMDDAALLAACAQRAGKKPEGLTLHDLRRENAAATLAGLLETAANGGAIIAAHPLLSLTGEVVPGSDGQPAVRVAARELTSGLQVSGPRIALAAAEAMLDTEPRAPGSQALTRVVRGLLGHGEELLKQFAEVVPVFTAHPERAPGEAFALDHARFAETLQRMAEDHGTEVSAISLDHLAQGTAAAVCKLVDALRDGQCISAPSGAEIATYPVDAEQSNPIVIGVYSGRRSRRMWALATDADKLGDDPYALSGAELSRVVEAVLAKANQLIAEPARSS